MRWYLWSCINLLLFSSCAPVTLPDSPTGNYGDLYFTLECVWRTHDDGRSLWWCSGDVETDLMVGYFAVELLEDGRLAFCGDRLTLYTGHSLHDNLVTALTQNQFTCIYDEEKELGNEFAWLRFKEERMLQIIWRPDDAPHKQLTLIIDAGDPVTDVEGRVYYKELN